MNVYSQIKSWNKTSVENVNQLMRFRNKELGMQCIIRYHTISLGISKYISCANVHKLQVRVDVERAAVCMIILFIQLRIMHVIIIIDIVAYLPTAKTVKPQNPWNKHATIEVRVFIACCWITHATVGVAPSRLARCYATQRYTHLCGS
jgi:hypothetical protein